MLMCAASLPNLDCPQPQLLHHQWELEPSRGVPRTLLPGPFLAPGLGTLMGASTQPGHGLLSVSALIGGCCSPVQHSLHSVLALMRATGFCGLAQPDLCIDLAHRKAEEYCSPAWPAPSPSSSALGENCGLLGEFPKFPYHVCSLS